MTNFNKTNTGIFSQFITDDTVFYGGRQGDLDGGTWHGGRQGDLDGGTWH